jgi:TPR repeat protein
VPGATSARDPRPEFVPADQQMEHDAMSDVESGRQAYMAGRFEEAAEIWRALAEAGDAEAQAWLGSLYANGEGVPVDDREALRWYLEAAKQGNSQAQTNVGAMYAMGKGTEKDQQKAVEWLTRAAENDDPHAQFNLAVLYTNGDGVEASLETAAEWYRKAAENGHYPSQSRLGHMYANGQGVKKDRVQAFLWLSLAGQHGIGTALNSLEAVVKQMSAEEKGEGLALMTQWRARTADKAGPGRLDPMPG